MFLQDLMAEYNSYVIHGISPKGGAGSPCVGENIPIWDRFRYTYTSGCEVRASTISGKPYGLWYPVGLVLKQGTVLQAYPSDGGTSLKDDKVVINDKQSISIPEQIRIAITEKNPLGYNELVITSPSYSGIYFCPSDIRIRDLPITDEILHTNTLSLDLPYYLLSSEGKFIPVSFDGKYFSAKK